MNQVEFSKKDIDQIIKTGQTPDQVFSQIALFHQGTPFVHLDRPCTVGDGISRLSADAAQQCIQLYETRAVKKKLIKFVPASGAATRMFKKLIHAYQSLEADPPGMAAMPAPIKEALLFYMDNCRRFAFYGDLKASLSEDGLGLETLLETRCFEKILRHLLTDNHMNYAMLPKGLIKFHAYHDSSRTAFEEHFIEAAGYAKNDTNECRLHFTVSPHYLQKFITCCSDIQPVYEKQLGTKFNVSFSIQETCTNTIAVDLQNRPFRLPDGRLLFRPGGHGALINNLNQLDSDLVFIKNIDNVAHDRFIAETIEWKKILCGYLIGLQERIFQFLKQLHRQPISMALAADICDLLEKELAVRLPDDFQAASDEKKQKILIHLLDRPVRVCGMVPNTGEPGGGPFWIKDSTGGRSLQIVETAQIDTNKVDQKSILKQLTHFNPVDLVCGIRNWRGDLFNLSEYVDHQAVFISNKSENGRDLKALELPGLWNGAMALWNTAFIEIPKITFNPVKEVFDLLDAHHQPAV